MSFRIGLTVRELRIHLCQTSAASAGVREFIQNNYVKIKQGNPGFPILIRECSGVQPCVWARYEKGVERRAALTNLTATDVLSTVKKLVE